VSCAAEKGRDFMGNLYQDVGDNIKIDAKCNVKMVPRFFRFDVESNGELLWTR
jgi:hypothetical protein